MKSVDFIVILAAMAHNNTWTIVKLWLEKRIHKDTFLDKLIPDVPLASTQNLWLFENLWYMIIKWQSTIKMYT